METEQSRKLAAILAADIAGYSRLMGADEARTVRDLKGHHAVVLPIIGEFGGRIIDIAGDGVLAEFASAVAALECAIAFQKKMAERNVAIEPDRQMQFRIGINIGDIIVDETRLYGDGINVAARLESIAAPGGISISRQFYDQVHGKVPIKFRKLGPKKLKNISKPIEVFAVETADSPPAAIEATTTIKPKVKKTATPDGSGVSTKRALRSSVEPMAWLWPASRLFATYAIAPIIVLLLAHYVIIVKLDLDTAFFRAFSLLFPAVVGFVLVRQTRYGVGAAFGLGTITGIASVAGMLIVVGLVTSTDIIPSSRFEWQEAAEYAFGIAIATPFGSILAKAVRSALSPPPGH